MANGFRGIEALRPGRTARRTDTANRQSSLIGILAALVAVLAAVLVVAGIATAVDGNYAVSIVMGYVAVGISVIAFFLGVTAIVTGRGRGWGALGVALSVLANPLVLQWTLEYLGGLG